MTEIAVLIAAHNSEKHLAETAANVLSSSIPVHLFIVDDASKQPVTDYISPQNNLTVIRSDENLGLAGALNLGLGHILQQNFKYIARLDADDLCINNRFARQREYLESHPDVGLAGSWLRFTDEESGAPLRLYRAPETHDAIMKKMPVNSCILHPTWFMRAQVIKDIGPYNPEFRVAQDYEFLMRLVRRWRVANVPEFLVDARDTQGGISRRKRQRQLINRLRIQCRYFNALNWRFYAGIAKTLLLLVIPYDLVVGMKGALSPARK